MSQKVLLADLDLEGLKNLIVSLGEKSFRANQIYKSIHMGKDFAI